jgi:hypothetical protein
LFAAEPAGSPIDVAEVRLRDLPIPTIINRECCSVSDVTVKVTAERNKQGLLDFKIASVTPDDPKRNRFLIPEGEINEPNENEPRPTKALFVGQIYNSKKRIEFVATEIVLTVIVELERTDKHGKTRPRPVLLVSARVEYQGHSSHYATVDRVTSVNKDGTAVWTPKETFSFRGNWGIMGERTKRVRVRLPDQAIPVISMEPEPPHPSRVEIANTTLTMAER